MEDLLLLQYTPFTMVAVHSNKKSQIKKKSNLKIEIELIHPTTKKRKKKKKKEAKTK